MKPQAMRSQAVRPQAVRPRAVRQRDWTPWKNALEVEQKRLQDELARYTVIQGKNLGIGNHMADDGTEAFEQAAALALHNNQERLLRQVEHALAKFDANTYSLCERCGEMIEPARLEALPHATLCLRCQRLLEQTAHL